MKNIKALLVGSLMCFLVMLILYQNNQINKLKQIILLQEETIVNLYAK